jgi:hypothetical protein
MLFLLNLSDSILFVEDGLKLGRRVQAQYLFVLLPMKVF